MVVFSFKHGCLTGKVGYYQSLLKIQSNNNVNNALRSECFDVHSMPIAVLYNNMYCSIDNISNLANTFIKIFLLINFIKHDLNKLTKC